MKNEDSIYSGLSEKRKKQQEAGVIPPWYTTSGLQMFQQKYQYQADNVKEQFERISKTAAKHVKKEFNLIGYEPEEKFFNLFWKGWLSPSTPVLANMGTERGMPVSCSGGVVGDSIDGFYSARKETAILTKNGFGTSAYLGDIRCRGSKISVGGEASGVVPVFKGFVSDMRDVSQGTSRRGAWAGYLPIDHGDFDELADYVLADPDDANVGWVITDKFIQKLDNGDQESLRRYQKAMKTKMVTGKGYFFFVDKVNAKRPKMYQDHGLFVKSSNLCSEIMLHSDENHTFTCVLSSMNVSKYDEWKDTDAVFWATVFLDCVAEEFIQRGSKIPGIENAVRFTEKGRALGLGVCGFHTYLQQKSIPFESLDAMYTNNEIFNHIWVHSGEASRKLAELYGEPEWCVGSGLRNTHRIAIAPTKSTAELMGGISEGINPDPAMTYIKTSSAGEMDRINPVLLGIMKERGVYTKKTLKSIVDKSGSVQHVNWLSDHEKSVFKTAFEINQEVVIRLASQRGKYIDQWQSLNVYFSSEEEEEWISHVHKTAFKDPNILALYYVYGMSGVQGSRECESCQ